MRFYVSLFGGSAVESVVRYGAEGPGPEGTVLHATFTLGGRRFLCIDSHVEHAFGFTPALSIHVACATEAEVDRCFERLADGGTVLMELGEYPFSPRYGWEQDRFGISWQLALPPA